MTLGCLVNSTAFTTNKSDENRNIIVCESIKSLPNSENSKPIDKTENLFKYITDNNFGKKDQSETYEKNLKKENIDLRSQSMFKKVEKNEKDEKKKQKMKKPKTCKKILSAKNEKPHEHHEVIEGYITAYTADPAKARTANGNKVRPGICAMNNKYRNCEVIITFDGHSERYFVDDTGGAFNRKGSNRIADIYMTSADACKRHGKRYGKVTIISRSKPSRK